MMSTPKNILKAVGKPLHQFKIIKIKNFTFTNLCVVTVSNNKHLSVRQNNTEPFDSRYDELYIEDQRKYKQNDANVTFSLWEVIMKNKVITVNFNKSELLLKLKKLINIRFEW